MARSPGVAISSRTSAFSHGSAGGQNYGVFRLYCVRRTRMVRRLDDPIIIVARELAITGLRLLARFQECRARRGGLRKAQNDFPNRRHHIAIFVENIISQNQWGSVGQAIFGWHLFDEHPWVWWLAEVFKWVSVALTFISGWLYLWKNRALYLG